MKITVKETELNIKEGSVFEANDELYMIVQNVEESGWRVIALDGMVLQDDICDSLDIIISRYDITKVFESELIVTK